MRRLRSSGARFALRNGYPVDDTPFAYLCPEATDGATLPNGIIIALAEPAEPARDAARIASTVVDNIVRACAGITPVTASVTLKSAFDAAHEFVDAFNAATPLLGRLRLGVSVVAHAGGMLFVAQALPGQILVRQDSDLYAFPPLDGIDKVASSVRPSPLGDSSYLGPTIRHTLGVEGDVVVALTSNLASRIVSHGFLRRSGMGVIETLEWLLDECDRQLVSTGHGVILRLPAGGAASSTITPQHALDSPLDGSTGFRQESRSANEGNTSSIREFDTEPLDLLSLARQTGEARGGGETQARQGTRHQPDTLLDFPLDDERYATQEVAIVHARDLAQARGPSTRLSPVAIASDSIRAERSTLIGADSQAGATSLPGASEIRKHDTNHPRGGMQPASATTSRRQPRGSGIVELLVGLILSLTAAVVGAWQVTKRDRPLHGPIDDGSFGLPRLQRWDESYRPPRMQRIRSRLPRLELSRIVVVIAILVIAGLAITYYTSRSNQRELEEAQETLTLLQQAEATRVSAASLPDPVAAYDALINARALLADASGDLVDASEVAAIQSRIDADIATVTRTHRLSNVQVIGGIPDAPSGVRPELVTGGGKVYLLADALYQVDVFSSTLVRLLASGDIVDGAPVGTIHSATWREDRIVAIDATRSYAFDITRGAWASESLSTLDSDGYREVSSVATFERNLYVLTSDSGQIMKFQAGAYAAPPEDWAAGVENVDLRSAVDMAIDGHVLVLMDDGKVLDLYLSRLEATLSPVVLPPLVSPAAIYASPSSAFVYILDRADGRIVRMSRDGKVAQQLTSPLTGATPILSGAVDLAVDEDAGLVYVLANDTVFTARLPAAPAE